MNPPYSSHYNQTTTVFNIQSSITYFAYVLFATFIFLLVINKYFGASAILHPYCTSLGLMEWAKYKFNDALARSKSNHDQTGEDGGGWKGFQQEMKDLSSELGVEGLLGNGVKAELGGHNAVEGLGSYYPGLLNAAGNLCFLNSVLQVGISLLSYRPVR